MSAAEELVADAAFLYPDQAETLAALVAGSDFLDRHLGAVFDAAVTVAHGQLFEGKGKVGRDFRLQCIKNAVQSRPMPARTVSRIRSGGGRMDKKGA